VRCAQCRSTWFVAAGRAAAATAEESFTPATGVGTKGPEVWTQAPAIAAKDAISAEAHNARAGTEAAPFRTLRKSREPRSATVTSRAGAVLTLAVTLGVGITAVLARPAIVGLWPETALLYAAAGAPVNLRGLALHGVRSEVQSLDQETVLVVEGEIENPTGGELEVPALLLVVQGAGEEALYTWTNEPPRRTLGPGETARFRARLASPPCRGPAGSGSLRRGRRRHARRGHGSMRSHFRHGASKPGPRALRRGDDRQT
jgi:hypothetical protein